MRTSQSIVGTVLLVCIMLLGVGPSAVAASGTHDTDDISRLKDTLRLENVTIPWSFPLNHATCKLIPAAVGSIEPDDNHSDRTREITREVLADGSQVIVQDDLIKGRARDTNDAIYHFVYKNHLVFTVSSERYSSRPISALLRPRDIPPKTCSSRSVSVGGAPISTCCALRGTRRQVASASA